MSGAPTEAEIQTQWKAAIDVLESLRAHADATQAAAGGKLDTLIQALEGEFTPVALSDEANRVRATLSTLVDDASALAMLAPIVREYANILSASAADGFGAASTDIGELSTAIYDWLHANSDTIETRGITYDTTPTAGGSNAGNGTLSRLTEDGNGYALEACHVEKKQLRCVSDANSGSSETAEQFEFSGEASSRDALLRTEFGSGENGRETLVNSHSGPGSSLLSNSSFSDYDASATPKFAGWTEASGSGNISQDTTKFYETHPGAQTDAALQLSGDAKLTQAVSAMRVQSLNANAPYFFRVMVNASEGSAAGGSVTIRLGSTSATATIASLSAGWNELAIAFDETAWFESFNEADVDVEIEWSGSSGGTLLIDCAILRQWQAIDGTFWVLRSAASSPTAWRVGDTLTVTDTGGAAGTGKLQYWWWIAGLGYLPSSGSPTITDP